MANEKNFRIPDPIGERPSDIKTLGKVAPSERQLSKLPKKDLLQELKRMRLDAARIGMQIEDIDKRRLTKRAGQFFDDALPTLDEARLPKIPKVGVLSRIATRVGAGPAGLVLALRDVYEGLRNPNTKMGALSLLQGEEAAYNLWAEQQEGEVPTYEEYKEAERFLNPPPPPPGVKTLM